MADGKSLGCFLNRVKGLKVMIKKERCTKKKLLYVNRAPLTRRYSERLVRAFVDPLGKVDKTAATGRKDLMKLGMPHVPNPDR